MGEPKPQIPFLFVGNQLCLDFINTEFVWNGRLVDLLATFSDLVTWLVQAHLLAGEEAKKIERKWGGQAEGVETLRQARAFRVTLRELVERMAAGRPVPQAAIEAINEMLRYRFGYPQLTRRSGKFERGYQVESQEANHLLGLLAEAATNLLCTCDFSLIKKCQNPLCVLFFYDTTKNHARHWCSMTICGNRSKVAAHYRRLRGRSR
ncbi:MAG TPA: ABATE domain-containing protein [Nitrospiraceae bacterium]|jgi:predicted RNA-binding Zn ribbon-like protein|nr:ABATE domain-containing protein [Nitrospiraceae bacterium]